MKYIFDFSILVVLTTFVDCYPEEGKWEFILNENQTTVSVPKSLFNGSQIIINVICHSPTSSNVTVSWGITESVCWDEYLRQNQKKQMYTDFIKEAQGNNRTISRFTGPASETCNGHLRLGTLLLHEGKDPPDSEPVKDKAHPKEADSTPSVTIPADGFYMLHLQIVEPFHHPFQAHVSVEMLGKHGYLSASDWPLLPFYAVMSFVYVIFGVIWLFVSFWQWRDLLRIQFWIGGVIFLGMLEKAMFYAEYHNINKTGLHVQGVVLAAEWVSCGKRTLARLLVVIVSLGFGIVRPRLGTMLHRVVAVGGSYLVLACTESYIRVVHPSNDYSDQLLIASIPLAALDSLICWWIFTALVQTTRQLRLRRFMVKLNLYRHFTNTLIFAVLASIIFMLYTIKAHRLAPCLKDWKELWVDDAFWHVLFSIILLVIMVLWRPTNNNQRYAFTPLLDNPDDDEEEDQFINDTYGVKMRSHSRAGSPKFKQTNEDEDILRWVDDNIPSAGVESALPIFDSDEEVVTTRFEVSKMM